MAQNYFVKPDDIPGGVLQLRFRSVGTLGPADHAGRHPIGVNMPGPLAGVRILDLRSVIMGPHATQMLADLGADVIWMESPEGDAMRHDTSMKNPGMWHIYLHANRNKRSIVLDLKQPAGRDAALRLAERSDVLVALVWGRTA